MTNVRYSYEGETHRIEVDGHAGYNPGNDIVCSAVSALTYTLANVLTSMVSKNIRVRFDNGYAVVSVEPEDTAESRAEIENTISTIMTGYCLLEDQHPNNVKVDGWGEKRDLQML